MVWYLEKCIFIFIWNYKLIPCWAASLLGPARKKYSKCHELRSNWYTGGIGQDFTRQLRKAQGEPRQSFSSFWAVLLWSVLEVSSAQAVVCIQATAAGHNSPPLTSSPPAPLLLIHLGVCYEDLHLFSSCAAAPHSWAGGNPCCSRVLVVSWQRQNQAHSINAHGFCPPGLVRTTLHQHSCCHRGVYCAGAIRAQLHPASMCRKPLQ